MASEMANRGKQALGFLRRLGGLITSSDLATIYKCFVRSRMEYGSASYIASDSGGLKKLDVVQRRAEKLSGVTFQPLGDRREASCFGLICKLLDGVCVQPLLNMNCVLSSKWRIAQVLQLEESQLIQLRQGVAMCKLLTWLASSEGARLLRLSVGLLLLRLIIFFTSCQDWVVE